MDRQFINNKITKCNRMPQNVVFIEEVVPVVEEVVVEKPKRGRPRKG
jgi:hypothetical protein